MRDASFFPLSEDEELVITADCAGAIGEKQYDEINVSYDVLAYASLRVTLMECLAVGGRPFAVIVQNFVNGPVWRTFEKSVTQICRELKIPILPIMGSSETNFSMLQSAVGFTVIGKAARSKRRIAVTPPGAGFAVIGRPLVGDEVISQKNDAASLTLFKQLCHMDGIYELVPVGSKGIASELTGLFSDNHLNISEWSCKLDTEKSAGPSTCFIISYQKSREPEIKKAAGTLFYKIKT
ncbi:ATPase [Scopulibacillus cellulosilyticus]|uniref:ATPase n=1 Tax=Scopulibacillus cellulosilyticus TaxID=2665665 RepID=A0ABW2PS36_9BACL